MFYTLLLDLESVRLAHLCVGLALGFHQRFAYIAHAGGHGTPYRAVLALQADLLPVPVLVGQHAMHDRTADPRMRQQRHPWLLRQQQPLEDVRQRMVAEYI